MTEQEIFLLIKDIATAHLNMSLTENDTPEMTRHINTIIDLEEKILGHFGLPETLEFRGLIYFKSLPSDKKIDRRIQKLHKTAREYLLSDSESHLSLLIQAKHKRTECSNLFPLLNVRQHCYTAFVYEEIFLQNKDSAEHVLNELQFVSNSKILGTLGRFAFAYNYYEGWETSNCIKPELVVVDLFEHIGLKYIRLYLEHLKLNYPQGVLE